MSHITFEEIDGVVRGRRRGERDIPIDAPMWQIPAEASLPDARFRNRRCEITVRDQI